MGAWAAHAVVVCGASVGLAREAAAALAEVAQVLVSEAEVAAAASAAVADADAGGSHSSCMAAPVPGAFAGDARLAAATPPINRSATRVMSWLHVYGFAECSQQQPLPDPKLTSSSSSSFVGTAVRFSRMDAGEGHGE